MIKDAIFQLARRENLSYDTARAVMDEIMSGQASDIQMSAYLTAMSMKGETIEEITASAAGMRQHCIKLLHDMDVLEIVGTGGDGSNSFNISTTAALVVAAAGVPVAKHGQPGGLEQVRGGRRAGGPGGEHRDFPREKRPPASGHRHLLPVRPELSHRHEIRGPGAAGAGHPHGVQHPGPLANPAGANMEVMGVYDERLVEPLARVLANLGVRKAMVVYGQDGLDEISMSAPTTVCEIRDGAFRSYELTPERFGFARCEHGALAGGSPMENAAITRRILTGEPGPRRQAVVLNAAAALYVAQPALTMEQAVEQAQAVIDSGAALQKLEDFIRCSNEE